MYNPYIYQDDVRVRQKQVIYLRRICEMPYADIAQITGYAKSTCRNYSCGPQSAELLAMLVEMFGEARTAEPTVDYTLYRRFKDGREPIAMEFMSGCGENLKNEQAFYFFKFYSADGLVFNKIGTTAKNVVARLRDEIGDYVQKYPIVRVEIHRIFACGDRPAEGAESALRSELIKQYPDAFRKNDRFFGVNIDAETIDKMFNEYYK